MKQNGNIKWNKMETQNETEMDIQKRLKHGDTK